MPLFSPTQIVGFPMWRLISQREELNICMKLDVKMLFASFVFLYNTVGDIMKMALYKYGGLSNVGNIFLGFYDLNQILKG